MKCVVCRKVNKSMRGYFIFLACLFSFLSTIKEILMFPVDDVSHQHLLHTFQKLVKNFKLYPLVEILSNNYAALLNEWNFDEWILIAFFIIYFFYLQAEAAAAAAAAAAAQNSSTENASNLASNNQQQSQSLPPNNVSSQPGAAIQQNSQPMRPISSPNSSSSGSRSMSPAVGKCIKFIFISRNWFCWHE